MAVGTALAWPKVSGETRTGLPLERLQEHGAKLLVRETGVRSGGLEGPVGLFPGQKIGLIREWHHQAASCLAKALTARSPR